MPESIPEAPPQTRFPLRVSPDRRRLLDVDGRPVLIQGDAAWSVIVNATLDSARRYIADRRRKGFNTIIVNLIDPLFATDPPRNLAGDEPFTTPGDFRTPNEAYMAHAERVLEIAEHYGIVVILAPAFLGYPYPSHPGYAGRPEGWYEEVVANGPDGRRVWGDYLGHRFGRFKNIIWCIGGDRNPGEVDAGLDQIAQGIRTGGLAGGRAAVPVSSGTPSEGAGMAAPQARPSQPPGPDLGGPRGGPHRRAAAVGRRAV